MPGVQANSADTPGNLASMVDYLAGALANLAGTLAKELSVYLWYFKLR